MKLCEAPGCGVEFTPQRSTGRFHSATCRQRAARARRAAAADAAFVAKTPEAPGAGTAEHSLVRAVRVDLESAGALDTVAGQLALQFARRIAVPDESSLSAMSKELRALLAEAKTVAASDAPQSSAVDDEVTRARRARERKAGDASAR